MIKIGVLRSRHRDSLGNFIFKKIFLFFYLKLVKEVSTVIKIFIKN